MKTRSGPTVNKNGEALQNTTQTCKGIKTVYIKNI